MVAQISLPIGLITYANNLHAQDIPTSGSFLPSLDWQKVNLERAVSDKIKTALSKVIKSNEFVVDVEINVNPPTKPKFTPQGEDDGAGNGDGDKNEDAGKIKIKDVKPDQLPKDYIVFSKLGLEAPLIDDFDNFKDKDGNVVDPSKKKDPLPPFEQLWKYNKSLDIFNNLESVKIMVQLSEKLHPSTRENVKKILNSLKFNLNEVNPELEITYINMEEKQSGLGLPSSLGELLTLLSKFSTSIGLVLAAILLGAIAYMLFNKWANMEKDKEEAAQQMAAAQQAPQEEEEEEAEDTSSSGAGGPFDAQNTNTAAGVERYETFLDNNPLEAILLLKKWIGNGETKDKNALRVLVQHLKNDTLVKIFAKLTVEEREQWKSYLDKQVSGQDLIDSNAFISNQIVEDILVPSAIVDAEACDTLMRITPDKAAQFIKENPELGKILLNVMSTKFVAKIFEILEDEYVELAVSRGLEYRKEDVNKMLSEFKSKLAKYKDTKSKVPFMSKILELIPISMPSKENTLFKALASNGDDSQMLKKIAMDYFPAVLVPVIPDKILKGFLQQYPMKQKIELVSMLKDDLRERFVNLFAPQGSKSSDMLQLELEKIETDLEVQRKIRETPDLIWKEFVDYARKNIRADKSNAGEYENIVTQWTEKVMGGESPDIAAQGVDPEKTSSNVSKMAA